MKKLSFRMVGLVMSLGLAAGLTGCCNLSWHAGCPPKIVTQPQSQLVEKGASASFTVVATPPPVFYQWQFNGIDIPGATTSSYTIASVDFINVGEYKVRVWGSPTNTSKTAYLSVYSTVKGNSGTLSTPVGYFSSQTYTCPYGGTFQSGYSPTDSNGALVFFYGPNASPQSGPFVNTMGSTKLKVDTFSSDNGTADTGLRLRNNWSPFALASPVGCNDDYSPIQPGQTDPKQSQLDIQLSTNAGSTQNSYRLTVFYKVPPGPPTSGKVTFNWTYHN